MTIEACREYESLLVRAADGPLEAGDQVRLDAHLAACGACRAALEDQRAVREALAARPILRAQPDFAVRVTAAIDADRSWLDRLDFRVWTWRLVPVAAALSLVAWVVVQSSTAVITTPSAGAATATSASALAGDLPVSAALWDSSVSDTALLSLMMRASANDTLADTYKER
jgi:predicted anti-sigma-YlaC factor YlaD